MATQKTNRIDFDHVKDEHVRLHKSLQEVRFALAKRHVEYGDVADFFKDLHDHLESHFSHEEMCGYFTDIIDILPQMKDQVEALRQQHPQLLECFEEVQQCLKDSSERSTWRTDTASLFDIFVRAFIAHERRENDLIQEAYSRDQGMGD